MHLFVNFNLCVKVDSTPHHWTSNQVELLAPRSAQGQWLQESEPFTFDKERRNQEEWKPKLENIVVLILLFTFLGGLPALHVLDVSLLQHTWVKWSAHHRALLQSDDDPFIWIRCAAARKHLKHGGQEDTGVATDSELYRVIIKCSYILITWFVFLCVTIR